jgi:hypothetical protein
MLKPVVRRRILALGVSVFVALSAAHGTDDAPISTPLTALDNGPAAIAAARERGVANARRDIDAGRLRIVFLSETGEIHGPLGHHDPETGYIRYRIAGCEATEAFLAEVDAYNNVMREFHAQQKQRSASNQAMQPTAVSFAIPF